MIGTLVLFSILSYAISNHLVYAHGPFHVYDGIRALAEKMHPQLGELFSCMICLPANVGWVASVIDWFLIPNLALTPFNILLVGTNLWWVALIADCCLTSGLVWIIHNVESFFESIANGTSNI